MIQHPLNNIYLSWHTEGYTNHHNKDVLGVCGHLRCAMIDWFSGPMDDTI